MKNRGMIILISVLLYSCAVPPRTVIRLTPQTNEAFWLWGNQFHKLKRNDIELFIAFDKQQNHYLVFDLSVANYSDNPIVVSPENFYNQLFIEFEGGYRKTLSDTVFAVDPEKKILEIDHSVAREDAYYATAVGYDLLGSFFDLAHDVTTVGRPKTEQEKQTRALKEQSDDVHALGRDFKHSLSIKNLNDERALWAEKAIRKTTLPPGYSLRGYIYFPIDERADAIKLYIPIGDNLFTIEYKQRRS